MKILEADIKQIIKDLQGNFGSDNAAQMKGVQLLKGLATSDDPLSNQFMQALDTATTQISKDILKSEDTDTFKCPTCDSKVLKQTNYCLKCKKKIKEGISIILDEDFSIPGTNITLEAGDGVAIRCPECGKELSVDVDRTYCRSCGYEGKMVD